MTHEEIIARIKKDYPPGTKFRPICSEKTITVLKSWKILEYRRQGYTFINSRKEFAQEGFIYVPFRNGKWAEIISESPSLSTPEPSEDEMIAKLTEMYPVGTVFRPVDFDDDEDNEVIVKKGWKISEATIKKGAYEFVDIDDSAVHSGYLFDEGKYAEIISTPTKTLIPVTKYVEGLRVQRGPDWEWGDQDGGAGKLGSIKYLSGTNWVNVKWDNHDGPHSYRIGRGGKYDLALANPEDAHLLEDKPVEEFHNPDKLTPEQVGEGYRLLYPSEIKNRYKLYESIDHFNEKWITHVLLTGCLKENTYRVPACFPKDFTEEYIQQYEAGLVSKEKPVESNVYTVDNLPLHGAVVISSLSLSLKNELTNVLIKKPNGWNSMVDMSQTYLAWNERSYWSCDSTNKIVINLVNKLNKQINNSENEKHTVECTTSKSSAVLQRSNLKIGQGSISRGVGLKGPVSKIRLGNHGSNYQERLS